MRNHILVVGGNDSSAVKAAQLDLDVTLFQLPRLLTQAQIHAVRRALVFDFERCEETLALARTVHAIQPLDAVISFWERGLTLAALIGETLGIAANPLRAVQLTRNKLAMRELLAREGMSAVRFRACESAAEVAEFLDEAGAPVVLKPATGSGSVGVSLITSTREIDAAWQWAVGSKLHPLIVEEYIEGPEYSVESLSCDAEHRVLGITEKFTTGPPHFIETGHRFPAELPVAVEREIRETVVRLLDSIGNQMGPAHTEVRLARGEPAIIETQTRFGGDQIWEMVELVTGVDLTQTTCAQLLKLPLPAVEPKAGGAAIRFFCYENCEIASVTGIEDAQACPGVLRVECKLSRGSLLGPLAASSARQGYIIAKGASSREALQQVEEAMAKIHVDVQPLGGRRQ